MSFIETRGLIRCFEDTKNLSEINERLHASVKDSMRETKFYPEDKTPCIPLPRYATTEIVICEYRTFETALYYRQKYPQARIAVHNFANALKLGGYVQDGSRSQEASLCRCSTLFSVLDTEENRKQFYEFHQDRNDSKYTDACIYTPDIMIFKSDHREESPVLLPEEQWTSVDVLTCAMPNLNPKVFKNQDNDMDINGVGFRMVKMKDEELFALHEKRAKHLLSIAAAHGVDILILGAFGCSAAFCNSPEVVAEAYRQVLPDYDGQFQEIVFAIYCASGERMNGYTFLKAFNGR